MEILLSARYAFTAGTFIQDENTPRLLLDDLAAVITKEYVPVGANIKAATDRLFHHSHGRGRDDATLDSILGTVDGTVDGTRVLNEDGNKIRTILDGLIALGKQPDAIGEEVLKYITQQVVRVLILLREDPPVAPCVPAPYVPEPCVPAPPVHCYIPDKQHASCHKTVSMVAEILANLGK